MFIVLTQAFPPAMGGIEQLLWQCALQVQNANHDVIVLADQKPGAAAFDQAAPVPVRRFGGPRLVRRWRKRRAVSALRPAFIICDSWKSLEALPRDVDAHVLVWAHGNEFPDRTRKLDRIKHALRRASVALIISEDTRARMARVLPAELHTEIMSPPVVPLDSSSDEEKRWAEKLWSPGATRFVSLCRLTPLKGIDQAINSIGKLPTAELVVIGDGEDRERLTALTQSRGCAERVKFVGQQMGGRKAALLRSADVFLQPGRMHNGAREGFGITYLEAGLAGLPVVSGRAGGAAEAVIDGVTGFTVDGEDGDAVLNAVKRLAAEPELRSTLGAAGQARAGSLLWSAQIERFLSLAEGRSA